MVRVVKVEPYTTLYTGASTITSTFTYIEVEFRAASTNNAPTSFKLF